LEKSKFFKGKKDLGKEKEKEVIVCPRINPQS